MTYKEARAEMVKGKKIARPGFKGYWYIDQETGQFKIHIPNGKDISYGQLGITEKNCAADDWFVVVE